MKPGISVSVAGVVSALFAFIAVFLAAGGPARADAVADFYKAKKQVVLIISSDVGGGYDRYARTMARKLGSHIPGNPSILPKNQPGAGGIRATNALYNQSPKDGSTIGLIQATVLFEPLLGNKQAQFDVMKINWLGSTNAEVAMTVVWHASPIKSIDDLRRIEAPVGATGAASTPAFYGRLQNALLGTKMRMITGYKSQTTAFHAMEQGEIMGFPSAFYSSLISGFEPWVREGKLRIIVQMALEKHPKLADVPLAQDLVADAESKEILKLASAPLAIGRPTLAPPGVPADRVAALRAAFEATMKDADYVRDASRQKLEVGNWLTGGRIEAILKDSYGAPATVVARITAIDNELRELRKKEQAAKKKKSD
ncbi:MAG: hypothetical protein RL477_1828 [Pseudomonadota bacterium]|jgi:tripartite-type tricarboxylate transporter receptor subunit TctC